METHEPISPAEASAALATVRGSRTRVAWAGYPWWYWVGTGAVLSVLPFAALMADWVGLLFTAAAMVFGVSLALAANRVRGVCEGWTRGAMRWQEVTLLYGPAVIVWLAGALLAGVGWWVSALSSVVGFALFAGTGLTMSARAARQ